MVHVLWLKLELFRTFTAFYLFSILCTSSSFLDIDELSVQYGIEITNKPVILKSQSVVDENILQLSSKHGQAYSCFLPYLPQADEKEPNEKTNPANVIDILDKSMNGTCITHKKGWWTYKLCHKTSVTQYHAGEAGEAEGVTTTLGLYSSEDDWSEEEVLQRKPSEIFHSHQYVNGSICDVTLKPRKATVQYFCATKAEDNIIRVEEPSTCEYIITVHNTKLCTHQLFSKKEKKKQISLVCSPALVEHEYNKYIEKLIRKKEKEEAKKMEILKKKKEKDEKVKTKPKVSEGNEGNAEKDDKLKDAMNDISSFMEGFMKAINIKLDEVKASPKIKIPSEGREKALEMKGANDFLIDPDREKLDTVEDADEALERSIRKLESKLDITDNLNDLGDSMQRGLDDVKNAVSELDTVMSESNPPDINAGVKEYAEEVIKMIDPNNDIKLPDDTKGKPGMLKNLNDITETMIQQLEEDSESMQKKASREREEMNKEFNRVRVSALKELERTEDMLQLFQKLEKEANNDNSKRQLQQQIQSVRTLVEGLQGQIKTIDDKRKIVDEMEKDTTKRLEDINKKIVNTRMAHKFAKSFEHLANEHDPDGDFNKIISSAFQKIKQKQRMEEAMKGRSVKSNNRDESGHEGDENKDDDPTPSKETGSPKDTKITTEKKANSKLVQTMLSTLKEQLIKLNTKIKQSKTEKLNLRKTPAQKLQAGKTSDATNGEVLDVDDLNKGTDNKDVTEEIKLGSKTSLNNIVDLLKTQIKNVNAKLKGKQKQKERGNESPDVKGIDDSDTMQEDRGDADGGHLSKQDKKDNVEVRIRTIDGKSFEKEFENENENLEENVREEVKQVTRDMEETVRKQLKDAGLDFSDHIKIKIITTKDKFDKFSSGKDVKLLSDDDAANFKDLLLGFLGGGKEKVSEEQRQRVLEDNYNFVLKNDDEE